MMGALNDAGVKAEDILYINTHATSTPAGDIAEMKAIQKIFESNKPDHNVYISSFKGSIGHLLGAAGSVETILTILSNKNHTLLPTLNLCNPDVNLNLENYPFLQLIQKEKIDLRDKLHKDRKFISLKNSFGFGGTNGSICLSNFVL